MSTTTPAWLTILAGVATALIALSGVLWTQWRADKREHESRREQLKKESFAKALEALMEYVSQYCDLLDHSARIPPRTEQRQEITQELIRQLSVSRRKLLLFFGADFAPSIDLVENALGKVAVEYLKIWNSQDFDKSRADSYFLSEGTDAANTALDHFTEEVRQYLGVEILPRQASQEPGHG